MTRIYDPAELAVFPLLGGLAPDEEEAFYHRYENADPNFKPKCRKLRGVPLARRHVGTVENAVLRYGLRACACTRDLVAVRGR